MSRKALFGWKHLGNPKIVLSCSRSLKCGGHFPVGCSGRGNLWGLHSTETSLFWEHLQYNILNYKQYPGYISELVW